MDSSTEHRGGCRCGEVNFLAQSDPIWVSYCHCADCRKASGAPVSAFVGFAASALALEGVLTQYCKGPVSRSFCPRCGTPVLYRDERLVNELYVSIGAMEAPERYGPEGHGFYGEKLGWLTIADSLPHDSGFTRARPAKGQAT